MRQLTASDFVNKQRKKFKIESLDGYVFLKKLSVGDAESFKREGLTDLQRGNEMISITVVDEDGNKVFNDPEALRKSSFQTYQMLTKAIMDYNDLTTDKTDEIEKN